MESLKNVPWEQGYQAYKEGQSKNDNPYVTETMDWYNWNGGWSQSKNDEILNKLYPNN